MLPRLTRKGVGLLQGFGLSGFAEWALTHENRLAVVPKQMPFAQAAFFGCGVAIGAAFVVHTANVAAGHTVVIFGASGVGLDAIRDTRSAGASRIVVIDTHAKRLEESKRFGATHAIATLSPRRPAAPTATRRRARRRAARARAAR